MASPEGLQRDFRRSTRFGLVGVVVVMAVTAAIALVFASNDAHPTGALIAIFAIVFGFVFVLLRLQRSDVDRAEARGNMAQVRASGEVTDPTTVDTNALLGALAVKPIDHAAIAAASERTWGMVRGSIRSATILMVLIVCAVVPWQLFTAYWSIYVFVPIIIAYVSFLAVRAIGAGGQVDQAYDDSAATLEPLGLEMTEGVAAYVGERHGRSVSVRIEGSDATTAVAGPVTPFRIEAKRERLQTDGEAPAPVAEALARLRPSSYWKGVSVWGDEEGVVVERSKDGGAHWMRDPWLAERLARAAAPR